jgi:hypothetical protein
MDYHEVPDWMRIPPVQVCGVIHPTGAAVCRHGRDHSTRWHWDPHAKVSWRRYPDEIKVIRPTNDGLAVSRIARSVVAFARRVNQQVRGLLR